MKILQNSVINFVKTVRVRRNVSVIAKKCYCRSVVVGQDGIVRSPFSPTPVPNQRIDEFCFDRMDQWPDKTAVICSETGRFFTFEQYQRLTGNVVQALCAKLKFKKGDVIAVLLPNVPEYTTIFFAAFNAGIILTTINPAYTADEIARQMTDCAAKAIITLSQNHELIKEAIKKLKTNVHMPIITVKHEKTDTTPEGTINFQELCEYNGPQVPIDHPSPDDLAFLPYSSGTSGLPKGVQLTHRNVVSDLVQIQHEKIKINYDTTSSHQDVVPVMPPLYHCYGMIPVLFNMFSQGVQCVFLPKYRPNLFLEMLEKHPGNIIHLVPPIVIMLINNENAKRHHLKRLRNVISAAAPLANTDIDRFQEKFGSHIGMYQYYGLTETGPVTHAHNMDREVIPGSVGWTLPLTESKIVSIEDESKILGPNESGHLLMRGPNIMPGYHNNPKATAESIDKDGWFKSGDIAYYNEDGAFFITDRMKELIKVKGFQVAPAELEALLRDHPEVADAAVVGIPHEQHGEAPKAFIVPRKNANLKPEHVQEYVKTKAAKHKHLTGGVEFIDAIPKNPSGKILRRMLKNN